MTIIGECNRKDLFSMAIGAIGVFLGCFPFYVSAVPPMADLPAHVLVARIVLNHGDSVLRYSDFFDIEWTIAPTSLFYVFLVQLQKTFGPILDSRIYLTTWVAGIWLSVWYLAKVLGNRNPWTAALVALPLAFCGYAYQGYLPFLMSLPLFAVTVAVWLGDWKPVPKIVSLWALLAVLFGFHIVGAAAAAAVIVVIAFTTAFLDPNERRTIGTALLAVAPLTFMTGVYLLGQQGPTATIRYGEPLSQLVDVIKFTVATLDDFAVLMMLLWVCTLTGYLAYSWRSWMRALPVFLGVVTLGLLSIAMPVSLGALWPAGPRLLPFALILLIAGTHLPERYKNCVSVSALCLLIGLSVATIRSVRQLDQGYRDILGAAAFVGHGKSLLPIIDRPIDSRWISPYLHAGDWVTIERGGTNPFVLATPYVRTAASPLTFRHPSDAPRIVNEFDETRGADYYLQTAAQFDYVLIWGSSPTITKTVALLGRERKEVYRRGNARLFAPRD